MMGTNKNIAYYNEGVSAVKSRAHEKDEQLTQVIIGGCVKTVGAHSFSMCNNVRSLTLENGIEEIGEEAFSYCTGLKSVTIPGSVRTIGKNAFLYGANIARLTLGDGVKTVEDGAFRCLVELRSVVIPDSVEKIGPSAFKRCVNLTEVKLGAGLKEIGAEAFYGCSSLRCVIIPAGVTTVDAGAFEDCGDITVIYEGKSYPNEDVSSIYDPQSNYPEGERNRRNEHTYSMLEYLEKLVANEEGSGDEDDEPYYDDDYNEVDVEELFGHQFEEEEAAEFDGVFENGVEVEEEAIEPDQSLNEFDGDYDPFDDGYVMLDYDKLCKAAATGMTVEELVDYIDTGEWDAWGEEDDPEVGFSWDEGFLPSEEEVFDTDEEALEWLENHSAPADEDDSDNDGETQSARKRGSYLNQLFGDCDEGFEGLAPIPALLGNLGEGLNDPPNELTDAQRKRLEELIKSGITLDEFEKLWNSGKLFDE